MTDTNNTNNIDTYNPSPSEYKAYAAFPREKQLTHTSCAASVTHDGRLTVDIFDFSEDAHEALGNDVADMLHVTPADKRRVYCLLSGRIESDLPSDEDIDNEVVRLLIQRLDGYYDAGRWFDANGIAYEKEHDG